jgi:large subunit ribosomal protein L32e
MAKQEIKKPQNKKKTIDKPKEKTQTKKTTVKKQVTTKKTVQKKTDKKITKESKKEKKPVTEEIKKPEKKEKIKEKKVKKFKKKPILNQELKLQLKKRKEIKKRTPRFLREEWFRYKRIPKNWRRPDGITSKMHKNLAYRPSKVRVGFRGPKQTRGLHSSGFQEVIVFNIKDLETLNPKTQAARIGSSVGTKKRIDIGKKAEELDIRLLNI